MVVHLGTSASAVRAQNPQNPEREDRVEDGTINRTPKRRRATNQVITSNYRTIRDAKAHNADPEKVPLFILADVFLGMIANYLDGKDIISLFHVCKRYSSAFSTKIKVPPRKLMERRIVHSVWQNLYIWNEDGLVVPMPFPGFIPKLCPSWLNQAKRQGDNYPVLFFQQAIEDLKTIPGLFRWDALEALHRHLNIAIMDRFKKNAGFLMPEAPRAFMSELDRFHSDFVTTAGKQGERHQFCFLQFKRLLSQGAAFVSNSKGLQRDWSKLIRILFRIDADPMLFLHFVDQACQLSDLLPVTPGNAEEYNTHDQLSYRVKTLDLVMRSLMRLTWSTALWDNMTATHESQWLFLLRKVALNINSDHPNFYQVQARCIISTHLILNTLSASEDSDPEIINLFNNLQCLDIARIDNDNLKDSIYGIITSLLADPKKHRTLGYQRIFPALVQLLHILVESNQFPATFLSQEIESAHSESYFEALMTTLLRAFAWSNKAHLEHIRANIEAFESFIMSMVEFARDSGDLTKLEGLYLYLLLLKSNFEKLDNHKAASAVNELIGDIHLIPNFQLTVDGLNNSANVILQPRIFIEQYGDDYQSHPRYRTDVQADLSSVEDLKEEIQDAVANQSLVLKDLFYQHCLHIHLLSPVILAKFNEKLAAEDNNRRLSHAKTVLYGDQEGGAD